MPLVQGFGERAGLGCDNIEHEGTETPNERVLTPEVRAAGTFEAARWLTAKPDMAHKLVGRGPFGEFALRPSSGVRGARRL